MVWTIFIGIVGGVVIGLGLVALFVMRRDRKWW
jgi:TRAP-type mannitol/chloroaromatic compound transport system permease large subunit